ETGRDERIADFDFALGELERERAVGRSLDDALGAGGFDGGRDLAAGVGDEADEGDIADDLGDGAYERALRGENNHAGDDSLVVPDIDGDDVGERRVVAVDDVGDLAGAFFRALGDAERL